MPVVLPDDILVRLEADFGVHGAPAVALSLAEVGAVVAEQDSAAPIDRLLRCLIHLAAGDQDRLGSLLPLARTDWRDVLVAAEYDRGDTRIHDFAWPFAAPTEASGTPTTSPNKERTPSETVTAFVHAMNAWELESNTLRRVAKGTPNPESYWPAVIAAQQRVFAEFCTDRPRPHGRAGNFQRPPEYDPAAERVIGEEVSGSSASVETDRESLLGGGIRRYILRRQGGRWHIDNVKHQDGDDWDQAIL